MSGRSRELLPTQMVFVCFERVERINPGESRQVRMELTRRDISNWDTASQNWVVTEHAKTIWVGSSSRDLPLTATLS